MEVKMYRERFDIDLHRAYNGPKLQFTQLDDGLRGFSIGVLYNNEPYDLVGHKVTAWVREPKGAVFSMPCSVSDEGRVEFAFSTQATTNVGNGYFQLTIEKDDTVITTRNIGYNVGDLISKGMGYVLIDDKQPFYFLDNGACVSYLRANSEGAVHIKLFSPKVAIAYIDAFAGHKTLQTLDLSHTKFRYIDGLVKNCKTIKSIDMSSCDMSECTRLGGAFMDTDNLEEIKGIEDWDVRKVTNMSNVFPRTKKIKTLDLSKWKTDSLTDLTAFAQGSQFENINVTGWNTSKVSVMMSIFSHCDRLKTLDISTWDMSTAQNLDYFLEKCTMPKVLVKDMVAVTKIRNGKAFPPDIELEPVEKE